MILRVYTDGACSNNPGPGGWGAVFTGTKSLKTLEGFEVETTNNRMELTAVVETLEYVYRFGGKCKTKGIVLLEVISDSAYVVNAITNRWLESWRINGWQTSRGGEVKNTDLWQRFLKVRALLESKYDIRVKFIKVKGHSGDTYNEYVDGVAKAQVMKAREYLDNGGDKIG